MLELARVADPSRVGQCTKKRTTLESMSARSGGLDWPPDPQFNGFPAAGEISPILNLRMGLSAATNTRWVRLWLAREGNAPRHVHLHGFTDEVQKDDTEEAGRSTPNVVDVHTVRRGSR